MAWKYFSRAAQFVFLALMGLVASNSAFAQTATITGTVVDSTGAVVAKAKITVHNLDTNIDRATESTGEGNFTMAQIPPGTYNVSVQASGFKVASFNALVLTVDQALTLSVRLEVGDITQSVVVSGETVAQIDTTDAQVSSVIDDRQVRELPLILRDPYQLILLTPGAIGTNSGLGGFSVNGSREQNNNFKLDGADNNDPGVPASGLVTLNPDDTEEFRVINSAYLPEFGRNSGAVIDIITRSGTNNYHGDLYEFGRWDALGARDFFNHEPNTPKNPYTRNDFGASFGGPIFKNKTFFFGNFEGQRFATTTTSQAVVPDPAFASGVFNVAGQVYDVSTPGSPDNVFGLTRDPIIQKVLALYPAPSPSAGDDVIPGVAGHLNFGAADHSNNENYTIKVDQNFSSNEVLSVRYIANKGFDDGGGSEVLPNGIGGVSFSGLTQSAAVHLASTFGSHILNDARVSGVRSSAAFGCTGLNLIDGLGAADVFGRGRDFNLPTFTGISCSGLGDSDAQTRPFGTYNAGDTLTWTKGRHTLKFGAEFASEYSNDSNNFSTRSTPGFSIFTNHGGLESTTTAAADQFNQSLQDAVWALFGSVDSESQEQFFTPGASPVRVGSDIRGERERDVYLFAQDQFKLTSNLTLNFGLRYEITGTPWEVHNLLSNVTTAELSGPSPITFQQVTHGGANPLYPADYTGAEPRVGFAWDPFKTGKTSVRGGYGIYRDRYFFNITGNTRGNPPAGISAVDNAFLNFGPSSADQISNLPIPPTAAAPSATVTDFPGAGSLSFPGLIDTHFKLARIQQWNLGVQRDLPGNIQIEVNYVGVKGNHLHRVVDGNAPDPAKVAQLRTICQDPSNAFGCVDGPNASDVQGIFLYVGQLFGVFPFNAVNNSAFFHANLEKSVSSSIYHGLQTTVTRRFSHGLFFQGAYTYSHSIDDSGDTLRPELGNLVFPANSFDLRKERGNSGFDTRHRFVMNYTAELPLGRGKAHLSEGFVGKVFEGWSLSGISTFSVGTPFEIFVLRDSDATGSTQRANFNPGAAKVPLAPSSSQRLQFGPNPGLFSEPDFGGPGNLGKNVFTGPGINNWDMVLAKTTKITERFNLEFRTEAYNIFNRAEFSQPHQFIEFADFGQSTTTPLHSDGTTTARQLQFALKLHF